MALHTAESADQAFEVSQDYEVGSLEYEEEMALRLFFALRILLPLASGNREKLPRRGRRLHGTEERLRSRQHQGRRSAELLSRRNP